MKVTVTVGDIVIKTQGVEINVRQVKELTRLAASIALALPAPAPEREPEPSQTPIGFSAHVERAPELPTEDWFTDDDE
jgi:hypothetical protein